MKLALTAVYLLVVTLAASGNFLNQPSPAASAKAAVRGTPRAVPSHLSLSPELGGAAAGNKGGAQEKQKLPGKMVLDDPGQKMTIFAGDKGKTPFDHEQHSAKDSCVTCHHTNTEKLTKAIEQPVQKCATCHKADEEVCTVEGTREGKTFKGKTALSSKEAFHGKDSLVGCIGCHNARNQEPKKCNDCHSGS